MSPIRSLLPVFLVLLCLSCGDSRPAPPPDPVAAAPTFVGRDACTRCHPDASELFLGSDHDLAMALPTAETVLGNFDDATFEHRGTSARFTRQGDVPRVTTEGPDGSTRDFPVAYAFGVRPLQQYLIEGERGRYQALTIPWDSRPAEQGGQRWYSLYPDETIPPGDPLHWTGTLQNWNYMCAECHSTNLFKNYDVERDTYDTHWSEIDVSCEACHGAGSLHVSLAEAAEEAGTSLAAEHPDLGLVVQLPHPWGDWELAEGEPVAERNKPLVSPEVETCARCHSRRTQIAEEGPAGEPLAEAHLVAFLNEGLYHPDGQIQDEVYVYGSFRQSKMYAKGVICSDCHEPHSLRLLYEDNGVCTRCHRPETFDAKEHHFHEPGTEGAMCVDCHMPPTTYMGVDARSDHSMVVPRPDLTLRTGAPNACNGCHQDQDARWSLEYVQEWYPGGRHETPHFATAFHAARRGESSAGEGLRRVLADPEAPAIVRGTALGLLEVDPAPENLDLLRQCIEDPDPLVRRAAAEFLAAVPPQLRVVLGGGLLSDPVRTVRISAVLPFAEVPADQTPGELRTAFERAVEEYRAAQNFNSDRPEGLVNLGNLEARLGNRKAAEAAYRRAVERHPWFLPAYVNLADVLRDAHRDLDGELVLEAALEVEPDNAEVHHSLGLVLVRLKRLEDALPHLERSAAGRPENPRFGFVYAVALYEMGDHDRALLELAQVHGRHPEDFEVLQALVSYHHEQGQRSDAGYWARKLRALQPDDPQLQRWLGELGLDS